MKRILVFCGSSPGRRPEYVAAAEHVGGLLAARKLGMVYGGASVGLMGAAADAALAGGGEVIGVITQHLVDAEIPHPGLADQRVVATMHERKALMAQLSDAVMVLPGGIGTLDELFEMFTWSQLGLHHKPIGLLDVAGYWNPVLTMLDHMVDERFLRPQHRETLLVDARPEPLLERFAAYEYRPGEKWVDRQRVPNTRSPASPKPGRM